MKYRLITSLVLMVVLVVLYLVTVRDETSSPTPENPAPVRDTDSRRNLKIY
jgi:hypothetical protein